MPFHESLRRNAKPAGIGGLIGIILTLTPVLLNLQSERAVALDTLSRTTESVKDHETRLKVVETEQASEKQWREGIKEQLADIKRQNEAILRRLPRR